MSDVADVMVEAERWAEARRIEDERATVLAGISDSSALSRSLRLYALGASLEYSVMLKDPYATRKYANAILAFARQVGGARR